MLTYFFNRFWSWSYPTDVKTFNILYSFFPFFACTVPQANNFWTFYIVLNLTTQFLFPFLAVDVLHLWSLFFLSIFAIMCLVCELLFLQLKKQQQQQKSKKASLKEFEKNINAVFFLMFWLKNVEIDYFLIFYLLNHYNHFYSIYKTGQKL